jgi:SAM-dependent methyltransferase
MKTSAKHDTGFRSDADKYAAYLATPEGRLRLDLAFANLEEFLPVRQSNNSLCGLDLGRGTGAAAVRLARLGVHVTMLDSSLAMLDIAKRAALEGGVSDQVTLKHGDATELSRLFNVRSFDVILCHNLLEYVEDPGAVLHGAVRLMRSPWERSLTQAFAEPGCYTDGGRYSPVLSTVEADGGRSAMRDGFRTEITIAV